MVEQAINRFVNLKYNKQIKYLIIMCWMSEQTKLKS